MRRFRATLILALLLAGLLLYTLYAERPAAQRRLQTDQEAKRLLRVEPAEATALTIQTVLESVTLEKTANGPWRITAPVTTRADQAAVAAVLDRLREAVMRRVVHEQAADADVDLKAFGLDPPAVRVVVTLISRTGGHQERLEIGAAGPVEATLFVRRNAETAVLLTDLTLKAALEKTLVDLRDKTVLRFDTTRAEWLRVEARGRPGPTTITREADGWSLTAPIAARADRVTVEGLLGALAGLKATAFVDQDKAARRAALSAPRFVVRVGLAGGEQSVAFHPVTGGTVYAVTSDADDPIFLVTEEAVRQFDKQVFDLRDKTVLTFSRSDVHEITMRLPGHQWTLTAKDAKDGGWLVDGTRRAKVSHVSRLLDRLERLRVERFLDEGIPNPAAKGLVPPQMEIELAGPGPGTGQHAGTTRLALLAIGREEQGLLYVQVTDGHGTVRSLMLARDLLEAIPQRAEVVEDAGGP